MHYTVNSVTGSGHVKYQENPLACNIHGNSAQITVGQRNYFTTSVTLLYQLLLLGNPSLGGCQSKTFANAVAM